MQQSDTQTTWNWITSRGTNNINSFSTSIPSSIPSSIASPIQTSLAESLNSLNHFSVGVPSDRNISFFSYPKQACLQPGIFGINSLNKTFSNHDIGLCSASSGHCSCISSSRKIIPHKPIATILKPNSKNDDKEDKK